MEAHPVQPLFEPAGADIGCAYIVDNQVEHEACGAPRRRASSYCARHHALCHVRCGTIAEKTRLREVEALANAVGGRRARDGGEPSFRFLRRLEHAVRDFS